MAGKDDAPTPPLPIFFNICDQHQAFERNIGKAMDQLVSQGSENHKSLMQYQRDTETRFVDINKKMDRQHERVTGEVVALREVVTEALLAKARSNGIAEGKAELTGEIKTAVRTWGTVAKWVAGVIAAVAATGGAAEGIRRLIGG